MNLYQLYADYNRHTAAITAIQDQMLQTLYNDLQAIADSGFLIDIYYYSVPCDEGWRVTVNPQNEDILSLVQRKINVCEIPVCFPWDSLKVRPNQPLEKKMYYHQ